MPESSLSYLLGLLARLRDPQRGSDWERQQTLFSLAPYTLEEAYEVVAAIESGNLSALRDELGDLLLQVVFQAQLAHEQGAFDFADVVAAIIAKLERRHPGLAPGAGQLSAAEVDAHWQRVKAQERQEKAGAAGSGGVLADVELALPASVRAHKLQARAAGMGFAWKTAEAALAKLEEELGELGASLEQGYERQFEELGDLYFAMIQLAARLEIDPEQALRAANAKFTRRFETMEARLQREGRQPAEMSSERWQAWWQDAKKADSEA